MLTTETISELQSKVDDVLSRYVGGFEQFSLEVFAKNKGQFYTDFGNQFIVSRQVDIKPSKEFKSSRMKRYVEYEASPRLMELILKNGADGFFENKIVKTITLDGPDGKPVTIKKGMKLSRSFKYFFSPEGMALESEQTRYSRILNSICLEGQLSLSCHPLDYLSMSMNKNGWSSCQGLQGDYAAGTLSLMNDCSTLVAYLSDGEMYEEVFDASVPWNSKKWRVLVHIDKQRSLVYFSKNYPYNAQDLEDQILDMLKQIYPDSKFDKIEELSGSSNSINATIAGGRDRVNYFDIGHMSKVRVSFGESFDVENFSKILVGHSALCCKCGDQPIQEAFEYCCYDCSESRHCCDCCGDGGYHEDDMYWINDESICTHCVDNHYTSCEACDEYIHNDDIYYFEETERSYCECCYDHAKDEWEEKMAEEDYDEE